MRHKTLLATVGQTLSKSFSTGVILLTHHISPGERYKPCLMDGISGLANENEGTSVLQREFNEGGKSSNYDMHRELVGPGPMGARISIQIYCWKLDQEYFWPNFRSGNSCYPPAEYFYYTLIYLIILTSKLLP